MWTTWRHRNECNRPGGSKLGGNECALLNYLDIKTNRTTEKDQSKSRASNYRSGLCFLRLDVWNAGETVCALTQPRLVNRLRSVERIEYAISLG